MSVFGSHLVPVPPSREERNDSYASNRKVSVVSFTDNNNNHNLSKNRSSIVNSEGATSRAAYARSRARRKEIKRSLSEGGGEGERRLRKYVTGKKNFPESIVDQKIVELLGRSCSLETGARSSISAATVVTEIHHLLSRQVSSMAQLCSEVWDPVYEILRINDTVTDLDPNSTIPAPKNVTFCFLDLFFTQFFKHHFSDLPAHSSGHLGLLTEVLLKEQRNKDLLQEGIEEVQREREQTDTLKCLNELLVEQSGIMKKKIVIETSEVEIQTDPTPPDPTLKKTIDSLNVQLMVQRTRFKIQSEKLHNEIWERDAELAKLETKCVKLQTQVETIAKDTLTMRLENTTNVSVQTLPMQSQFKGNETEVFEDIMNFSMPSDIDDFSKAESEVVSSQIDIYNDPDLVRLQAQILAIRQVAPSGSVALVFTDVQSSTFLWNLSPTAMRIAIRDHNKMMRANIKAYRGYEVKTEGDAFMVSFHTALDACRWCCETQKELLDLPWPEEILGAEDTTDEVYDEEGVIVFRGIRVRMGIHVDEPLCEEDPTTLRTDYFGPVVNFAARVSSKGRGGEIVISREAYDDLKDYLGDESHKYIDCGAHIFELGVFELKGFSDGVLLWHIFPTCLVTRRFHFKKEEAPAPVMMTSKVPAPIGEISLVFTDVQSSTYLWNEATDGMITGLEVHNVSLRALMIETNGYEVKTEGDAFMIAFENADDAARWCMQAQLILLSLNWDEHLLTLDVTKPRDRSDGGGYMWRGLRVRMGIHVGVPLCQTDPTTGRMDYFGPVVNKAARVSGCGHGGETVVSRGVIDLLEHLFHTDDICDGGITTNILPPRNLKGFADDEVLTAMVPTVLAERYDEFVHVKPEPKVVESQELTAEQKQKLEEIEQKLKLADMNAPKGTVTLVCSAVTTGGLWNSAPEAMTEAIDLLVSLYHSLLSKYNGYIVRIDGDALVAAFHDALPAARFCIELQVSALEVDWPKSILNHAGITDTILDESGNVTLWHGLQVKAAMFKGKPLTKKDPVTLRVDYYGPAMQAATELTKVTRAGEILTLGQTAEEIMNEDPELDVQITSLGELSLPTEKSAQQMVRILPSSLVGRAAHLQQIEAIDDGRFDSKTSGKIMKLPSGDVTIVFVDIEGSLILWEEFPREMELISSTKNKIFTECARLYQGYQAVNEGDGSMLVFATAKDACRWCLNVQLRMMKAEYPDEILEQPSILFTQTLHDDNDVILLRGIRLRMAIHGGIVISSHDDTTNKMTYKGICISKTADILDRALGGQILCLKSFSERIESFLPILVTGGVTASPIPTQTIGDEMLVSLIPTPLLGREAALQDAPKASLPKVERRFFRSEMTPQQLKILEDIELNLALSNDNAISSKKLVLCCIDIANSRHLWNTDASKMRIASTQYCSLVRTLVKKHGGKIGRVFGCAFLVLFDKAQPALELCLALQTNSVGMKWPDQFGDEPVIQNAETIWNGPRLRTAVGIGEPIIECTEHGISFAMGSDMGNIIDISCRARGGEIIARREIWQHFSTSMMSLIAIAQKDDVVILLPAALKGRQGQLEPLISNENPFERFIYRPAKIPTTPSVLVAIKICSSIPDPSLHMETALEFLSATENRQHTVVYEGSCVVQIWSDANKLMEWIRSFQTENIKFKVGINFLGIPPGPSGEDKVCSPGGEFLKTASKLCGYAHSGEVLCSSDSLNFLSQSLKEYQFHCTDTEIEYCHRITESEERSSAFIDIPRKKEAPWFAFHTKDMIRKKPKKNKEQSVLSKIVGATYNQRFTIMCGTLVVLRSLESDCMACCDHELLKKPPRSNEAFHLLSTHYRAIDQMLEGPTSIHFIEDMKVKSRRLNAIVQDRSLAKAVHNYKKSAELRATKLWLSFLQLRKSTSDKVRPPHEVLLFLHKKIHRFVDVAKGLAQLPPEGQNVEEHQTKFIKMWLPEIEGPQPEELIRQQSEEKAWDSNLSALRENRGTSKSMMDVIDEEEREREEKEKKRIQKEEENRAAFKKRISNALSGICCGTVPDDKATSDCVFAMLLKILTNSETKQPVVENNFLPPPSPQAEKAKLKIDLNKMLMGAVLPGAKKGDGSSKRIKP